MTKKTLAIIVLVLLVIAFFMSAKPPVKQSVAFVGVNVIPMDKENVLMNQTVLIENGKIKQIGNSEAVKLKNETKLINAKNKYLIPGLFDMHVHFFYEQGEHVNTCEAELKVMLANGLTTVRIECGDTVYLKTRKNVIDHKWIGPSLFISSPQFVGQWPWKGMVNAMICKTPEEAVEAVRTCKKEGYDEIKITFMVKRDVYDAIIRTAKQEHIKVNGHVGPLVKLPAALKNKQQIEHMDEFIDMLLPDTTYNHGQSVSDMNIWSKKAWATVPHLDERKIPELVKMVREAGIYVTPTNYFFFTAFGDSIAKEEYMTRPDYDYIPEKIKEERWMVREHYFKMLPPKQSREKYVAIRKKMTHELQKTGVKLMAGSDSPEWFLVAGFSLHDELETFVNCGMSPYAALETATKNPATYLGLIHNKGTVEVGKIADLLLLENNPLENIRNTRQISGVMKDGKWYDKTHLNEFLNQAKMELSQ